MKPQHTIRCLPTRSLRTGVIVAAMASSMLTLPPVADAAPLGTAFTYQGRVKLSGTPLNATVDFQFSLWDDPGSGSPPTGGTQLGATQAVSNVTITGGLFTVQLNAGGEFDPTAFNGEARWLQIAVRSRPAAGPT